MYFMKVLVEFGGLPQLDLVILHLLELPGQFSSFVYNGLYFLAEVWT